MIHLTREAPDELLLSLVKGGPLPTSVARDELPIEHGRIFLAPPDRHLLLGRETMRVVKGPHENRVRPAIDPLFRTAANVFDGRVIAVILSGGLNDGTYGAMVVNSRGGTVVVQDPGEFEDPSMPRSAVQHARVDFVEKTAQIGARIQSQIWAKRPETGVQPRSPNEPLDDELELVSKKQLLPPGERSPLICPECKGPLWLKQNGTFSHFRCHEGDAYTGEVLAGHQSEELEGALWSAVRVLDEHAALLRRLSQTTGASDLQSRADETEAKARLIRNSLLGESGREGS